MNMIISSKEIFMKYRGRLTDEQIGEIINCRGNIIPTHKSINKSKNDSNLLDWLTDENVKRFGIDENLAIKNYEAVLRAVEQKGKEFL